MEGSNISNSASSSNVTGEGGSTPAPKSTPAGGHTSTMPGRGLYTSMHTRPTSKRIKYLVKKGGGKRIRKRTRKSKRKKSSDKQKRRRGSSRTRRRVR